MKTLPLAEVKNGFSGYVDEVVRTHESVRVTRNGEPAVVMISDEDYESMIETIAVLSDHELVAELAQADRDVERGDVSTLGEVATELRERGRLA